MENNKHLDYLDIAKGITILLVVLGHSFPENVFTGTDTIDKIAQVIYDFVYSFHMPVFFYISGWLFWKSWINHQPSTLDKKVMRLLIPYITFSIIYIPLRMFLSGMANSSYGNQYWKIFFGVSPNGGVWYLYLLFIFFALTLLLVRNLIIVSCVIFVSSMCISCLVSSWRELNRKENWEKL